MTDTALADVHPHTVLCPLPGKLWWRIEFVMRLNDCHMTLQNGRKHASLGDTVVVLDVSDKSAAVIVAELIEGSYTVWQDWFRKVGSDEGKRWLQKATDVRELLDRSGGGRFKAKVNRSGLSK